MSITLGSALDTMQAQQPLIHNISNYVAMNSMANILLAAGASPAMVHAVDEVAEFVQIAHALTINIGTLSPDWVTSMQIAAEAAQQSDTVWVLDPVAVGATAYRQSIIDQLRKYKPTIIRGNAAEILQIAEGIAGGKGVDAGDAMIDETSIQRLAIETQAIVIATGKTDVITDGKRLTRVHNGHPMMPKVTTLGCSLTGIVAAFAATHDAADRFDACTAALAYYGIAGENAALQSSGPGSFAVAFIDALASIDASQLDAAAKLDELDRSGA